MGDILAELEENGTIRISKHTRGLLQDLGTKRETYDDVINRLIKSYMEG